MLSFHRLVGLIAGPLLILGALTGAVLVFAHELDHRWDSRLHVTPAGAPLPYDSLLAGVRAMMPECTLTDVMTVEMRTPTDALIVRLSCGGPYREAIVNPYDGHLVGVRDDTYLAKTLFNLHTSLWLEDPGRLVLFVLGMALVVLSVSGIFSQRRLSFWLGQSFRAGVALRVALADVHCWVGIVGLVSNIALGLSGMYLTSGAIVRMLSPSPDAAVPEPPPVSAIALDRALAVASAAVPGFRANWVVLPRRAGAPIALWGEVPEARLYGMFGSSLSVDATTGEVTMVSDVRTAGTSGKLGLSPLLLGASGVTIAVLRRSRPVRQPLSSSTA